MGTRSYRVTTVADYKVTWDDRPDDPTWTPDDDVLHDAIMDNYDTVDLEFTAEHPLYDWDGDEIDEMASYNANAYNICEVEVIVLDD